YSKLLGEAVRELAGHETAPAVDPVVSVDVEGFLPEEYVPEVNQRLALYKRLTGVTDEASIGELRAELADRFGPPAGPPAGGPPPGRPDRFGPPPAPVEQLLDVVPTRVAARPPGVEKIEAGRG